MDNEIIERYISENKGENWRFTETYKRSWYEESWSETRADRKAIMKFAIWYASQSEPELQRLTKLNKQLSEENETYNRKLGHMKGHLSWVKTAIEGLGGVG